jgi:hypothetical protein
MVLRNVPSMLLTIIALLASLSIPTLACNEVRHINSGAIAYRDLKQSSPSIIQKTIALIKNLTKYSSLWKPTLYKSNFSPEDQNLYRFMLAGRWSYDIRGNNAFHNPKWHYMNFPFKPGITSGTLTSLTSLEPENILTTYNQNRSTINGSAANSSKAVALCCLFHLIRDVHQPLHTTASITQQFPPQEGDHGGPKFFIKDNSTAATISLHNFEDDLIQGFETFQSVRNRMIQINTSFKQSDLKELTNSNLREKQSQYIDRWYKHE